MSSQASEGARPLTTGKPVQDFVVLDLEMAPGRRAPGGEALAEILRDIADGRRYVDPEIAASALTEDACPLTDRELDMLRAAHTGISVDEIAQQVPLAPGTVRNYLSTAMAKLHVDSRHAAAHPCVGTGWI